MSTTHHAATPGGPAVATWDPTKSSPLEPAEPVVSPCRAPDTRSARSGSAGPEVPRGGAETPTAPGNASSSTSRSNPNPESSDSTPSALVDTTPKENSSEPTDEAGKSQLISSRPLIFLMLLAILYTLYFARAILLPVALAIVLSLLLRPVVRWLSRRRIPESVGATLCLVSLIVVVVFGAFQLIGPAQKWVTTLPEQMQTIGGKLQGITSHFSQITEAKAKIEEIAAGEDSHPLEVQVQQPTLTSNAVLLSTTGSMFASIGLVIVLTYFLLTAGDSLINNIITTMPTFREKRLVVELIQNVQRGVSSYLFAMSMINVGLGVAVTLAMWALGLPNPALWGLMITFLNFVPYIGAACTGVTIGLVALLTFDSVAYAALAPLVFFSITTIEGQIITPALLGRHMSLNPIMVFLFLTFWGWMWGVGGAVIAVPILAVTRIACDQFERTRPLGTMLSG